MKSKRYFFFALFALVTGLSSPKSRADEMQDIVNLIQQNTPPDTEVKMANTFVAYSSLMGLMAEIVNENNTSMQTLFPNLERDLRHADDLLSSNPNAVSGEYESLVNQLKDKLVVLLEGTNSNLASVQNLETKMADVSEKVRVKYAGTRLEPLVAQTTTLTHEFTTTLQNYAIQVNQFVGNVSDVRDRVFRREGGRTEAFERLATSRQSAQKYSFTEIAQRFRSIATVLKLMYNE